MVFTSQDNFQHFYKTLENNVFTKHLALNATQYTYVTNVMFFLQKN